MIFYFSGTGNSQYFAEKISETTGESLVSIATAFKRKEFEYTLTRDERIGFVMPVYFYGIPSVVKDFIKNMKISGYDDNYCFVAFTCGATTSSASGMLKKALQKKGIALYAEFAVAMVDNYVPAYEIASPTQAISVLKNAEPKIIKACEQIKNKDNGCFNKIRGTLGVTNLLYPMYGPFRHTGRFYATDKCISCGKCADNCPCVAIDLENGKPVWKAKKCTLCLRCLHDCPTSAIQRGKGTEKRNRYMNPNIKNK